MDKFYSLLKQNFTPTTLFDISTMYHCKSDTLACTHNPLGCVAHIDHVLVLFSFNFWRQVDKLIFKTGFYSSIVVKQHIFGEVGCKAYLSDITWYIFWPTLCGWYNQFLQWGLIIGHSQRGLQTFKFSCPYRFETAHFIYHSKCKRLCKWPIPIRFVHVKLMRLGSTNRIDDFESKSQSVFNHRLTSIRIYLI